MSQCDLFVFHGSLAGSLESYSSPEAQVSWWKAHVTLAGLVSAGAFVSAKEQQFLESLRTKLKP